MWKVFLKGDLGSKAMEQCSHIYNCVHRSFSRVLQVKKCVGSAEISFYLKGQFCQILAVSTMCFVQESALDEAEFQFLLHIQWFTCAWFYPCYFHSFPANPDLLGSPLILFSSFLPVLFDAGSPLFSGQVLMRVWKSGPWSPLRVQNSSAGCSAHAVTIFLITLAANVNIFLSGRKTQRKKETRM